MKNYLLIQFDLHHRLYNNVLDGFTEDETNRRLKDLQKVNHVKYLSGHLLNSQFGLANAIGLRVEVKWDDLFAVMGKSKAQDGFKYPGIDEIKKEWNQLHQELRNGLKNLTDEELTAEPSAPFNQVAGSVGDLWAFINHHQAYHIGQIGILRRAFGKDPMSYE